jgi:hypothetical protein
MRKKTFSIPAIQKIIVISFANVTVRPKPETHAPVSTFSRPDGQAIAFLSFVLD